MEEKTKKDLIIVSAGAVLLYLIIKYMHKSSTVVNQPTVNIPPYNPAGYFNPNSLSDKYIPLFGFIGNKTGISIPGYSPLVIPDAAPLPEIVAPVSPVAPVAPVAAPVQNLMGQWVSISSMSDISDAVNGYTDFSGTFHAGVGQSVNGVYQGPTTMRIDYATGIHYYGSGSINNSLMSA